MHPVTEGVCLLMASEQTETEIRIDGVRIDDSIEIRLGGGTIVQSFNVVGTTQSTVWQKVVGSASRALTTYQGS